ncbi:MAG TPA: c(7)-type cytochrome triheme domain-containing protein [Casimicrobiaceae bacterium]|nr:c(7)-type cytochrome triheme domain-containing protein [Casimicrobiaceae bacterium]
MRHTIIAAAAVLAVLAGPAFAQEKGKATFEKTCALCHGPGLAGAPRFGQAAEWAPRIKKGLPALYNSALKGTAGGMPGKGGNLSLSDDDVKAAVDYMVAAAGGGAAPKAAAAEKPAADKAAAEKAAAPKEKAAVAAAGKDEKKEAKAKDAKDVKVATVTPVAASAAAPPAAAPASPPAAVVAPPAAPAAVPVVAPATAVAVAPASSAGRDPNSFNRLLSAPGKRNAPPPEDGIHDPTNAGTFSLQPPLSAFTGLPTLGAGNRVNWVKSLGEQKIHPRWDRNAPDANALVMDLNIVREVKGTMPDVVYPHKQHTEWLDCSNCHPAIFIPQKGANQISMAEIMMGRKCGVCHGKVAFPVSECRLCHSKNKESPTLTASKPETKP